MMQIGKSIFSHRPEKNKGEKKLILRSSRCCLPFICKPHLKGGVPLQRRERRSKGTTKSTGWYLVEFACYSLHL